MTGTKTDVLEYQTQEKPQLQPADFLQQNQKHILEKRQSLQQMVLRKLDIHM
jgi:hypothetical protein